MCQRVSTTQPPRRRTFFETTTFNEKQNIQNQGLRHQCPQLYPYNTCIHLTTTRESGTSLTTHRQGNPGTRETV